MNANIFYKNICLLKRKVLQFGCICIIVFLFISFGSISISAIAPLPRIDINGVVGINQLIEMSSADDTTFQKIRNEMGRPSLIQSQEDAKNILEFLGNLYFPIPKNGELANFTYQPDGEYAFCSYTLNGNYYLFDFWGKENILNFEQEDIVLLSDNEETNTKIYKITKTIEEWTVRYVINIQGLNIFAQFRQNNNDISINDDYILFEYKKLSEIDLSKTSVPTIPEPPSTKEPKPITIKLNKSKITMKKGKKVKLIVKVSSDKAKPKIIWSVSSKKVLFVIKRNKSATIKALKKGQAIVKAKLKNGKTAKCTIKIK